MLSLSSPELPEVEFEELLELEETEELPSLAFLDGFCGCKEVYVMIIGTVL